MRLFASQVFLFVWLALATPALGQRAQRPLFKARVYLKAGGWVSGTLDEVDSKLLYFVPYREIHARRTLLTSATIPLDQVGWVVLRRTENRQSIRTGLALGALLGGYLGYQSSQTNRFRSPVLGGISIGLSALTVAMVGGLAGSLIGVSTRRTIRPLDAAQPVESLERQLKPFTKVYLDDAQFGPG